jgi:predicted nucleotidyltransferase
MIHGLPEALEQCVRLDALVLFGSRGRGDARPDSDWDVAIVSAAFEGLDPLRRGLLIERCMRPRVELVCLTPAELLRPDGSYLRCAILEEGTALLDRGAFARARTAYLARKGAGRIRFKGREVEFARPVAP